MGAEAAGELMDLLMIILSRHDVSALLYVGYCVRVPTDVSTGQWTGVVDGGGSLCRPLVACQSLSFRLYKISSYL